MDIPTKKTTNVLRGSQIKTTQTHTRWPFSSLTRKSPFSNPDDIVAMFITGKARRNCAEEGTTSGLAPGGPIGPMRLELPSIRARAWDSIIVVVGLECPFSVFFLLINKRSEKGGEEGGKGLALFRKKNPWERIWD
jgi:hypothetical protein